MDLSKQSRKLLDFAAEADGAPLHARRRGRQRFVSALAAGTLTTSAIVAKGAALGASASIGASATITATLVSAVAIGFSTGLVVFSPSARNVEKPPANVTVPSVVNAPMRSSEMKPSLVESQRGAVQTAPTREPELAVFAPVRPQKSSIARETELLATVQRALKLGQPATALDVLAQYAEECPTGLLYEEATAARVVALCSVGRVQDGRRWAEEFMRRYPRSPLVPRVRDACSSASNEGAPSGTDNE